MPNRTGSDAPALCNTHIEVQIGWSPPNTVRRPRQLALIPANCNNGEQRRSSDSVSPRLPLSDIAKRCFPFSAKQNRLNRYRIREFLFLNNRVLDNRHHDSHRRRAQRRSSLHRKVTLKAPLLSPPELSGVERLTFPAWYSPLPTAYWQALLASGNQAIRN